MTEDPLPDDEVAPSLLSRLFRHHRRVFAPAFVVVLLAAVVAGRDATTWVVLAVLALGALAGPRLGETPSWSHGLPGVPDGPVRRSPIPAVAFLAVSVVALVLSVVLVAYDAPPGTFVGLGVVTLVAWVVTSDGAIRTARQTARLRRALEAYAPTTAMGYAGRSGGPWQLRMWEPYIRRSGERCVVISLHEKYAPRILEGAELGSPFVQLGSRGTDDLDHLLVRSIRAVFYVQNARLNAGFLRFTDRTHVWLNHGDSDKPANFNPRHALYDKLVVCGQAGVDRYERHGIHIDQEKFVVLGRPQAAGVMPPRGPISELDTVNVLYAPTWQGLDEAVNFSSLEKGPDIVRALIARGMTVIFRPHPLSYRWRIRRAVVREIQELLKDDKAATGRRHIWGKRADTLWSVVDCSNKADALISDVSSVVSDFLQSEKPYAMTSMHGSVEDFRAEFSVAETGYVLLGDLSNLDEVLDDLLDADPLVGARRERRLYVLGDFQGEESADAFATFVRELARGA